MSEGLTDYQLGNQLLNKRRYKEAIAAFLTHAADYPEDVAKAFERVAECHIRLNNDRKAAESYYRKALELDPEHFNALAGLSRVLPERADERLAVLEKAVEIQPNYLLFIDLGDFYRSVRKDYSLARDCYESAWRMNPKDKTSYQKIWALCSITGDKAESEIWSERWREHAI